MADTKEPQVFMQGKAGVLSCAGIAPRNDQYGAENIRRKYCMPHQITARHRMSLTIHSWCVGSWLKGNLASAQPAKTLKDSRQKRVWSPPAAALDCTSNLYPHWQHLWLARVQAKRSLACVELRGPCPLVPSRFTLPSHCIYMRADTHTPIKQGTPLTT